MRKKELLVSVGFRGQYVLDLRLPLIHDGASRLLP